MAVPVTINIKKIVIRILWSECGKYGNNCMSERRGCERVERWVQFNNQVSQSIRDN
jgi:hypothetical protein